jgi:hypothetical protein
VGITNTVASRKGEFIVLCVDDRDIRGRTNNRIQSYSRYFQKYCIADLGFIRLVPPFPFLNFDFAWSHVTPFKLATLKMFRVMSIWDLRDILVLICIFNSRAGVVECCPCDAGHYAAGQGDCPNLKNPKSSCSTSVQSMLFCSKISSGFLGMAPVRRRPWIYFTGADACTPWHESMYCWALCSLGSAWVFFWAGTAS